MSEVTFYWSKDGGSWQTCEVQPRSVVAWQLGQVGPGEVWDDGYGNRYKWERRT